MSDTGPAIENKYFDQQFCRKVTRVGAIACAATLVGDVLFLALVDPLHSHCAGAIQKLSGGGSIWELVAAVGVWAAWIGLLAIKWEWVAGCPCSGVGSDQPLAQL